MFIRNYQTADLDAVVGLFQRAVHGVDPQIYTRAEQAQWSPKQPDLAKWAQRLSSQEVFLAIANLQEIVGFISLEPDGHIDYTYVDPEFQRQGIAKSLYCFVEALAIERAYPRLYVEASKLARPFFEQHGFRLLSSNTHPRGDQVLINYSLEKFLSV